MQKILVMVLAVAALSACGEKTETAQQNQGATQSTTQGTTQKQENPKPQVRFKATPPPDPKAYKNPPKF